MSGSRELESQLSREPSGRRVAILTPCGDSLHAGFVASLTAMIQHTYTILPENLESFSWKAFSTSILPFSRYAMTVQALRIDCTHALWIDSDMAFPQDMLVRFLERDEDIIGINACRRRPPYTTTAQSDFNVDMVTDVDSTGLEKAYRIGMGVMWVNMDVFRKLDPPWFDVKFRPDLVTPGVPQGSFEGEDHYFCMRAKEAGYDIWVDQDLSKQVDHLGTFGFTPLMHEIAKEIR